MAESSSESSSSSEPTPADIIIIRQTLRQVHAGQNGYLEVSGIARFDGVVDSQEMEVAFKQIENFQATPLGGPLDDETIYVDESQVDGYVPRGGTGTITIARTGATPTDDLAFFFRYIGR